MLSDPSRGATILRASFSCTAGAKPLHRRQRRRPYIQPPPGLRRQVSQRESVPHRPLSRTVAVRHEDEYKRRHCKSQRLPREVYPVPSLASNQQPLAAALPPNEHCPERNALPEDNSQALRPTLQRVGLAIHELLVNCGVEDQAHDAI